MNETQEITLYLVIGHRAYRIKAANGVARIERQAHGGSEAASQKAYTLPYILSDRYWNMPEVERLVRWYEKDTGRQLAKEREKAIRQAAPHVRKALDELLPGKDDSLQSGYEIGKQLKAMGFSLDQITPITGQLCPSNIRAGIQIELTGLYD